MAQAQGLVDIHNILFMRKNGDTWQRHAKPHKLLMFPSRHEIQLIREQQEEEEEGKTVIVVLSSAVGGVLHASLHARSIMRLTIQGTTAYFVAATLFVYRRNILILFTALLH
jgi:hypothetical protein